MNILMFCGHEMHIVTLCVQTFLSSIELTLRTTQPSFLAVFKYHNSDIARALIVAESLSLIVDGRVHR